NRAWVSYTRGRFDEAITRCGETLDLEPGFGPLHLVLGLSYEGKGNLEEALVELERALTQLGANTTVACIRAYLLGKMGRRQEAAAALQEVEALARGRYVSPVDLAFANAGIGEKEKTFDLLRAAYEERSFGLVLLNSLPFFHSIRDDPRF